MILTGHLYTMNDGVVDNALPVYLVMVRGELSYICEKMSSRAFSSGPEMLAEIAEGADEAWFERVPVPEPRDVPMPEGARAPVWEYNLSDSITWRRVGVSDAYGRYEYAVAKKQGWAPE